MVNIELSEQYFDKSKFDSFCQRYKFIFPDSFLNYLIKFNDSELDSNIINGSERGIYVRYFYGTTTDMYSDIESIYECYERRLPSMCVPIGDADFGNLVCMSLHPNSYGKIYFWEHESMDTEEGEPCTISFDDMILLSNSFEAFLDRIIPYNANRLSKRKGDFFERIKKWFKK